MADEQNQTLADQEESQTQSMETNDAINALKAQAEKSILSPAKDTSNNPVSRQRVSLMAAPPIVQMKFMNWVSDSNDAGLYGTLADFRFKPNLEEGVFTESGKLIPMSCECSVTFTVIHTDHLGWTTAKNKRTPQFPYQMDEFGF